MNVYGLEVKLLSCCILKMKSISGVITTVMEGHLVECVALGLYV